MTATRRNGFTVVELLMVSVLGALVVGVTYQVLILNQRTYIAQNAKIESQQTVRAGLDVLFSELRELSTAESDILEFGSDTLKVRAVRGFGLACAVNVGAGTLDVLRVGSWFEVGDSVVVYAENDDGTGADDDWIYGTVTARDTTISCGSEQAQRLSVPVVTTAAAALDTVRVGASLRSYAHYTYGLFTLDGESYLGHKEWAGSPIAMVGPLRNPGGLAFRYLDAAGAVTAVGADIRQVEVALRTLSNARGAGGQPISDSIVTRIYLRN